MAGIHARSTAAAVLVVAVALVAGAALLLVLLRQSLIAAVADGASARMSEVVDQLQSDDESGLGEYLGETNRGGQLVQVLAGDGSVIASSAPRSLTRPLSSERPASGLVVEQQVDGLPGAASDEKYLVLVRGVSTSQGNVKTVVVASPLTTEDSTVDTVQKYLLAGSLPLLLLVGVATWVLVGRSLRPVEQIRSRVQGINATQFHERVPVPGTNDEIARLARTMNEMLDRLEAAQTSQRRFVSDASHELRSPLATVTVGLEVAGPAPTGAAWQELRAMMQTEAGRMQLLVADLLLLAKVDDTGLGLERADVDLDDIVGAEVQRLRMSTTVHIEADIAAVRVSGDTGKLAQVVRNLADNASRAASGRVRLSVRQELGTAVIRVDDDGPGIAATDRDRVFERFVRLDESRERGQGGSGLGLAIVAEVVHGHGGAVSVAASDLGGARFEVRLPAQEP